MKEKLALIQKVGRLAALGHRLNQNPPPKLRDRIRKEIQKLDAEVRAEGFSPEEFLRGLKDMVAREQMGRN